MAKEFEAALFDIDGTILNTDQFILQAFRHSLNAHAGRDTNWDEIATVLGKTLKKCYELLEPGKDPEQLAQTHMKFQQANLHLSVPYDGSSNVLRVLSEAGVKIGAVTSRHNDSLSDTLEMAGVLNYFDTLVSADDVVNHKPHPEPIHKALETLRISPQRTIMIGDTEFDILAGKSAGTRTVGVTYGFQGEGIRRSNPDYVIDDIREVVRLILK